MDLPAEYGVHPTFNITDLVPFTGTIADVDDNQDLRANPLQGGSDDVTPTSPTAPSSLISRASPLKGPITRSIMKKIQKGLPLNDHKFNGFSHYLHGPKISQRLEEVHENLVM